MKQIKQMKINRKSFVSRVAVLLFASCLILTSTGMVAAQTRQLPISYYLDKLSLTSFQGWFDPASENVLFIDQYGKLNTRFSLGLPTIVNGTVTVMSLRDGTEQVTVNIQTTNAICWGRSFDQGPRIFVPAFGYRPTEVINQLGPASLGDSMQRIVYAPQLAGQFNPRGAYFDRFTSTVRCDGLLRSGSGFPDGTEGFAQTTQVALFTTGVPTGCPLEHDGDCFPAEHIQFKPTGH